MQMRDGDRRFWRPVVTASHDPAATDWEASFDPPCTEPTDRTWVGAVDVEGTPAWLIAGPSTPALAGQLVLSAGPHYPVVRIADHPEIESTRTGWWRVTITDC